MRQKLSLLLLILLIGGVYLATARSRAILDDGDALYATVAREMFNRGDWVVPYANGVRFLDKPPLMYWSMALSYSVFGVTEFGARFPSVLAVLGCAVLLFVMAREAAGETAGYTAALAGSLSIGTFLFTRMVFPDMLFLFFLTLSLCGFARWYTRPSPSPRAALLFYAGAAGGVLSKGLIGVVFPTAIVVLFLVLSRDLGRLRRFYPWRGSALFLALALPWHLEAARRVPGFLWYYFVNEHFLRFLGRRQPLDYESIPLGVFWGLVLIWFFPWSAFLPAIPRLLRAGGDSERSRTLVRIALVWVAVVVVFFSASSRIEHYAMPVLPPLALLVAVATASGNREAWTGRAFSALAVLGCLIALALLGMLLHWTTAVWRGSGGAGAHVRAYQYYFAPVYDLPAEVRARLVGPLVGAGTVLSLGLLSGWWLNRRRHFRPAILALGATVGAFCLFAYQSLGICEGMLSTRQFASAIRAVAREGDRVVVAGDFETANSLNFYTDLRLEVYGGTAAVLQWGLRYPDAPKIILSRDDFEKLWSGPARVFVLAADERLPSLALGSCQVLLRSSGRTCLCNQPLD